MEHRRPDGGWGQGYFCANCGKETSMYGHTVMSEFGKFTCERNSELVKQCQAANPSKGTKPRFRVKG